MKSKEPELERVRSFSVMIRRIGSKNDLGVYRDGEVELIFFEITDNPLEVDGFARTIETTIGEEFDDTFVGGGRVPVVIDGKTPH